MHRMNDDRLVTESEDDDHSDAVIAADDTGMIASERLIAIVDLEEGLDESGT
ncbi:MAG: hypothetical protein NVS2B17_04200 [Candidatus Velthaea sp.]